MFEPMNRERLETIFETFKCDALLSGMARADWDKTIDKVKALAIEALGMRPRPLAEIDKAETALVIERDQHSQGLNVFVLNCYGSGHWKRSPASQAWLPSTLAIPLSSIAKVTP